MKRAIFLISVVIFSLYIGLKLHHSMKTCFERVQNQVSQIAEVR